MSQEAKAILAALRSHVERGGCTLTPADVEVLEGLEALVRELVEALGGLVFATASRDAARYQSACANAVAALAKARETP